MIRIQRTPNGYSLHGIEATGLPPRQSQILLTMANGMTQKAAAEALGCKQPSIRNATSALLYKLHAKNSAHAVANAFASGNPENHQDHRSTGCCLAHLHSTVHQR